MTYPDLPEYLSLSKKYGLVPVYTEFLADTETPVSLYLKLAGPGPSCLLESMDNGSNRGRYSFVATDSFLEYRAWEYRGELSADGVTQRADGPPLELLGRLLESFRAAPIPGALRFYGGAVGYWAYDLAPAMAGGAPADSDSGPPHCHLFFPGTVAVFDHRRHTVTLLVNVPRGKEDPTAVYRRARRELARQRQKLADPLPSPGRFTLTGTLHTDLNDGEFTRRVEQALSYIRSGLARQVVLSRRYTQNFRGDDLVVYRRLRSVSPSPYMYYLRLGEQRILGASPEMMVRVENRRVTTCPIAGTRCRGTGPGEDRRLAADLLADPKERSEHEMLVEMSRADLKRICTPDSIRVTQSMTVQHFSHVMHLVSRVEGDLAPGTGALDALAACFPAGTVSGAPKKAAMEIINRLEPGKRGVYAGAVGYVGFGGNMDTALAIRTLVVQGDKIHIQAGAGIVAASQPERECREIAAKAAAMFRALEAGNGRQAANL